MRTLISCTDVVLVSFAVALLKDAEIAAVVFDLNVSVMEGSLNILPRRVMVADDDWQAARALMRDAGLGGELVADADGPGHG
jgi:Putative prokaryotic signal transducing protein